MFWVWQENFFDENFETANSSLQQWKINNRCLFLPVSFDNFCSILSWMQLPQQKQQELKTKSFLCTFISQQFIVQQQIFGQNDHIFSTFSKWPNSHIGTSFVRKFHGSVRNINRDRATCEHCIPLTRHVTNLRW